MNWTKIAEIALTCIASVGGVGAIIVWVIKFSSDSIAKRLSQKYQLQLDKEKEKYKTELSKKEYVSKTRFETEFKMYQDLSEKNIAMVYCAGESVIITRVAPYTNNEITQFIEEYCKKIYSAEASNRKYAPFISKEFYEKYLSLEKQCTEVFRLLKAWNQYRNGESFRYTVGQNTYQNQSEVAQAMETKQKELSDNSNQLLDDLRDYLSSLDVL